MGFLLVAAGVFATLPYRAVGFRPEIWAVSALGFGVLCSLISLRSPLRLPMVTESSAGNIMTAALIGGVALRIMFPLIVTPLQVSDATEYRGLATGLASKGSYEWIMPNGNHWYAWRPPGTAAVIALFVRVFGDSEWLPVFINIGMYATASLFLRLIALRCGGPVAGVVSQVLFATWISNIASTGMYQAESIFLAAVYGSVLLVLTARSPVPAFAAGFATGLSVLVRQALLPAPLIWLANWPPRRAAFATAGLMAAVIPWTIRNHALGVPVTVSSNTGSMAYMVTGDFDPGAYDDSMVKAMFARLGYQEAAQNQVMGRIAVERIMAEPVRWAGTVLRRLPWFLGEDSTGLYFAMRVARRYEGASYLIPQVLSQAWWAGIWILATVAILSRGGEFLASDGIQYLLCLVILFTVTALPFHMQPRYHAGLVPAVLVIAGGAFRERPPKPLS